MQGPDSDFSIDSYVPNARNRYSAKKMAKPVNFRCFAPDAHRVTLAGDFNDWDPAALPMKRQPDGNWLIQVPLNHGHHHYLFVIDGKPVLDPNAQGTARNERDEKVSLLSVS
ncbi:MAG TPA: isoamylase early set domain-containing protein [Verrucomicrobiae bacterium]|nr:isoamylase early set domain-containing protein [Verrucomicrobiae bacterium]